MRRPGPVGFANPSRAFPWLPLERGERRVAGPTAWRYGREPSQANAEARANEYKRGKRGYRSRVSWGRVRSTGNSFELCSRGRRPKCSAGLRVDRPGSAFAWIWSRLKREWERRRRGRQRELRSPADRGLGTWDLAPPRVHNSWTSTAVEGSPAAAESGREQQGGPGVCRHGVRDVCLLLGCSGSQLPRLDARLESGIYGRPSAAPVAAGAGSRHPADPSLEPRQRPRPDMDLQMKRRREGLTGAANMETWEQLRQRWALALCREMNSCPTTKSLNPSPRPFWFAVVLPWAARCRLDTGRRIPCRSSSAVRPTVQDRAAADRDVRDRPVRIWGTAGRVPKYDTTKTRHCSAPATRSGVPAQPACPPQGWP